MLTRVGFLIAVALISMQADTARTVIDFMVILCRYSYVWMSCCFCSCRHMGSTCVMLDVKVMGFCFDR